MTTINTIEDLARTLREQPTWAKALRPLLLTQELLDLPDRFVEIQQETNQLTNRRTNGITDPPERGIHPFPFRVSPTLAHQVVRPLGATVGLPG